jgi:WD40 repeat protein
MKHPAALLLLLLADSSYRRESVDPSKFELLQSSGPVRSSTLSPAGTLYGVYAGNKVVLYGVKDQKEVRSLSGHDGNIHDSGWSRDGKVFATSGYDGKVIVWDVASGSILDSFAAHSGYA